MYVSLHVVSKLFCFEQNILKASVADLDLNPDPHVFGPYGSGYTILVVLFRGMDPDPSLDPDPSIIMQK
jgi:hypothetical protein